MTKFRQNRNTRDRQRGIAMIAALIALLLIAAITAGMIILSNTDTNISANFRDEQKAYFASRGGLAEVRERMRGNSTDSIKAILPAALPGTPGAVLYLINPLGGEVVAPWNTTGANYPDDEICTELPCVAGSPGIGWYTNPGGVSGTGSPNYAANPQSVWKWVRVMHKVNRTDLTTRVVSVDGASTVGQPTLGQRVCWDQVNNHELVTLLPSCQALGVNIQQVYEVTSLARTPLGTRRLAQFELATVTLPPMPGAMIFDGPGADYSNNPNSAAFGVSGADLGKGPNNGVGCPAPTPEPALGAYSNGDAATLSGQVNRPNSYTSNAPYNTSPSVANVNNQLGTLATVDGLTQLVNSVTAMAGSNVYTPPAGPTNMGTDAAPVINVINGDLTLSAANPGAGILLVTGTLTLNGNFSYDGLILVIGKGSVLKNGGGGGVLNGSLFVANMYSDPPPTYVNPIPLGFNNPPGKPIISWNGGGNASINYDSCWINQMGQSLPLRLLTSRELIY